MQHGGKLQESHTAGTLTHPCMVSSQCQGGNEACGRDDVLGRAGTLDISWPETLSLLAQRDPRSLLVWSRGCVPQALHLQSGGGYDPRRPCRRRSPWRARGGRRTCPWAATRSWPWELLLALWGCAKCLCYTICVTYVVVTPVWGSELSKLLSCLMVFSGERWVLIHYCYEMGAWFIHGPKHVRSSAERTCCCLSTRRAWEDIQNQVALFVDDRALHLWDRIRSHMCR